MSASNLTQLFDFEGNFEDAAQLVLAASGVTAFISQEALKLPLANALVGFDVGPALDLLDQIPKPTNWPANTPAPQEYFRYTGSMEFVVEVPRDANASPDPNVATLLRQVRGLIRAAMMRVCFPFNDSNLPLYRVTDIRPNGATTGFEGRRNVDYTSLKFVITFEIQPTAWPAWVET